jgi:hypothetical protein
MATPALPVELGQGDQGQHAVREALAIALQGVAAVAARLAIGNAQVDQLVAAEQRHVAGGEMQRVPLEAGAGDQHLALGVALLARRVADRVAGLDHQQRLVAVQDVERRELL